MIPHDEAAAGEGRQHAFLESQSPPPIRPPQTAVL